MSRQQEKRARFARMFPARVDTLRDTLRKIANCSNKGNYDWDTDKVQEAWLIAYERHVEKLTREQLLKATFIATKGESGSVLPHPLRGSL